MASVCTSNNQREEKGEHSVLKHDKTITYIRINLIRKFSTYKKEVIKSHQKV